MCHTPLAYGSLQSMCKNKTWTHQTFLQQEVIHLTMYWRMYETYIIAYGACMSQCGSWKEMKNPCSRRCRNWLVLCSETEAWSLPGLELYWGWYSELRLERGNWNNSGSPADNSHHHHFPVLKALVQTSLSICNWLWLCFMFILSLLMYLHLYLFH